MGRIVSCVWTERFTLTLLATYVEKRLQMILFVTLFDTYEYEGLNIGLLHKLYSLCMQLNIGKPPTNVSAVWFTSHLPLE